MSVLDILIDMTIIMTMNIYITKDNEKFLKTLSEGKSMSGLINELLNSYRKKKAYDVIPLTPREIKPVLKIEDNEPLNKAAKDYSLCKHGQVKGFCKQGCK